MAKSNNQRGPNKKRIKQAKKKGTFSTENLHEGIAGEGNSPSPFASLAGLKSELQSEGEDEGEGDRDATAAEEDLESAKSESLSASAKAKFADLCPKPQCLYLRRQTKGRGGRSVTIIDGFTDDAEVDRLKQLAKVLKVSMGSGGTVREPDGSLDQQDGPTIEVQSADRDRLLEELAKHGLRAKIAGG